MIDWDSIMPHRDGDASSQRPRLIILSTGGTTEAAQGGAAENLVGAAPRLADLAELEALDVLAKPSADFTLADIAAIADAAMAAAKTGAGIVITHGTDTLEESAFALLHGSHAQARNPAPTDRPIFSRPGWRSLA
jgi:L-asparaginase/Glu-tRNA(Gln) amidotransferase subunit D